MTVEEKEMQPPNGTKPFEKNGGVDNKGMDISDEGTSTSGDSIREAYVKIKVTKPQMNQPEYDHFYGHSDRPKRSVRDVFRDCKSSCECSGRCIGRTILGYLPFLKIMRTYQKDWISLDLIAGITIGIMQIPQGLAYALLAGVDPVIGLYVSLFPVLIYYFFGTSKHVSNGTFAVVCLMIGAAVEKYDCSGAGDGDGGDGTTQGYYNGIASGYNTTTPGYDVTTDIFVNTTAKDGDDNTAAENACKLKYATALTLLAGAIQFAMGIFKIGFVVKYLSIPLTRGFTTGCSIHVFTSQIKYVLGISTDRYSGPLKLIYTYRDIFKDITTISWASVVLSVICMIILYVTKEYANPPFRKKFKVPLPIDLIIVIVGTIASYYGDFEEKYEMDIVGEIPTGIPPPVFPDPSLFGTVIVDAIIIAIVSFAISVSMAQLFADKYNYDVDANQELVAHGLCNLICANLNCFVMCVSLSRTAVLDSIGCKTQVYALWSCLLILLVIYFIAPFFGPLPLCVLAAIIIVALKGLFKQFEDLPKYWRISGTDFSVWLVTFIAVVIMDVGYGLVIGIVYAQFTVVGRTQKPYVSILGKMPGSSSYKDVEVYKKAENIPGVAIFRFDNAIYYANQGYFVTSLYEMSGNNPKTMKVAIAKCKGKRQKDIKKEKISEAEAEEKWPLPKPTIHSVVIDCSVVSYTDAMGVTALRQVFVEYLDIGINVKYAAMNDGVREMLESGGFFEKAKVSCIYPTVHDAVYDSLIDYPETQKLLVNNVVDAPYTDDVPETTLSDQRKRAMSHSRFRNRTLSQAERAVENEYVTVEPRKRSATQEGYYNMKLVVDDVMDIKSLDEELREYEEEMLHDDTSKTRL